MRIQIHTQHGSLDVPDFTGDDTVTVELDGEPFLGIARDTATESLAVGTWTNDEWVPLLHLARHDSDFIPADWVDITGDERP